jgi:glucosylceramidase
MDPIPNADESNRPATDTALANFSLTRDGMSLIPYIKAAQAVKPDLRFWASPWTPPVWMKTGYKKESGGSGGGDAKKASYYDGGTMKSDAAILASYAEYFKKFVEGYKAQGIPIEVVSPQNEPGYDQNYPSCLWEASTFVTFIKTHLGPAMMPLGVKVMLGTMSNAGDAGRNDTDIAKAVLADSAAKGFVALAGAQWGVLDLVKTGAPFGTLPVWATEHKCGNYPWNPSVIPRTTARKRRTTWRTASRAGAT